VSNEPHDNANNPNWAAEEIWIYCDSLLTPFKRHEGCLLHINRGKIQAIIATPENSGVAPSCWVREPGTIVAPGFVDLHVHGAGGRDAMEGTEDAIRTMSHVLARHGTTSYIATTMSAAEADLETALRGFAAHRDRPTAGAQVLGVHLEGPYINPLRRGTHPDRWVRLADVSQFRRLVELSGNTVRRVTLAPEMDPALELTREAARLGIRVSIGHTDATFEQAEAAAEAGACQATHTFNAMRPWHQREPGILGFVLTDDRIDAEVIADGKHVHAAALRLLFKTKGVSRVLLVTDATSATGMPDGDYRLGEQTTAVRRGECRDRDGNLAGSTLTLDRAVRFLVNEMDMPFEDALWSATAAPARSMGLGDLKGRIAPGADADLVFLNGELEVVRTIVSGRTAYRGETATHV
jgi:N-acetylglucosamine-6-phosphate deacetylase